MENASNNIPQDKIVENTNKEESTKPTQIPNENFSPIITSTFKRPITNTNLSISNIEPSNSNKAQDSQKTRIAQKKIDQKLESAKEFITVSQNSLVNFVVASHGQSNIIDGELGFKKVSEMTKKLVF